MSLPPWIQMPSALDLAARSTILLAIVLGAWRAVGRRRPLIGSAIGQAGLLGLLALPIAAGLGPPLPIPLLGAPVAPALRPATAGVPEGDRPVAQEAIDPAPAPIPTPGPPPAAPAVAMPRPIGANIPAPASPRPTIDPASVLLGAYALVTIALLARLAGSLASVGRLRRSGVAVDDPAWLDALARLRVRLGIARPVGLAWSGRVGVPVVVGWLRPTILLPEPSASGPVGHAEAILLHELAHVRRGDYAWNVLLHLVGAVYWPHPMAWLLARAVAESRERACDAFCVHQMGGPARYRAALLAMAEGLGRRPGPALGLAMAGRSRLGRRVAEIDRGRGEPRCLPRWPARLAAGGVILALAAALGPARITRAEPRPGPAPTPAPAAASQEPKPAADPPRAPGAGRVLRLRVVAAETGKPVPRADVRVWLKLGNDDWRRTDEEGRLDIAYDTGPDDRHPGVDAWGDGLAMQRHNWGQDPRVPVPDEATIKLQPGESLGGLVRDEEDRPVAGAVVYLWSHNYQRKDPTELLYDLRATTGPDGRWHTGGAPRTTGEITGIYITHPDYLSDREYVSGREKPPIEALRAGQAASVMKKGVPIEGRVLSPDGKPVAGALVISTDRPGSLFEGQFNVRTDAEGRFRTGQVKAGEWHLVVRAPGHAPAARKLKVGTATPHEEIRLEAPHPFHARVVDPGGKPIEGAFVNIDTWRGHRCLGVFLYSDADGRVRWDDAPGDDLTVNIDREGYVELFQHRTRADSDLIFTLKPALRVSGTVRDAETKKRVERADVEYGAVDPGTGEVPTWRPSPRLGWTWFDAGRLNARFPVEVDAYKVRITAEGYQPFVSRAFRREDKVVLGYDVALIPIKAGRPTATATRPDGRPLAGARVYLSQQRNDISLLDGRRQGEPEGSEITTDANGSFAIPRGRGPTLVLILAEDCFALASAKELEEAPRLRARPFGRVEGRYLIGTRPGANKWVGLRGHTRDDPDRSPSLFDHHRALTDADGRFAFDKVIPMPGIRVGREDLPGSPSRVWTGGDRVEVEGGRTTVITVGGTGRTILGQLESPRGWDKPVDFADRGGVSLQTDRANNPFPLGLLRGKTSLDDRGWQDWIRSWPRSPEARAYNEARVTLRVALEPDGSFRIDDVPAGEYRVTIHVNEEASGRERGPFAALTRTFSVPPMPGGRSDEPLDLGVLRLRARAKPQAGDPAPPFEVTTVDGRKLAVPGDFAGKFVLLDFGTMWDDQSRLQVVRMNDVSARFGQDGRFALLSLVLAADRPESRAFVAEKGEPWPQAIIGPLDHPIADAYGIEADNVPAALLIGPDGRIVARDLFHQKIGEAIARALGITEAAPKP